MEERDPARWRLVPSVYPEDRAEENLERYLASDMPLEALGRALDAHKPKGLGILLPFSWQMHWYAYREASARNILTAVAMPTNVSALSGVMRSIPIEAVVATEEGARALEADLSRAGLISRILCWVILSPSDAQSVYVASSGSTVHVTLP